MKPSRHHQAEYDPQPNHAMTLIEAVVPVTPSHHSDHSVVLVAVFLFPSLGVVLQSLLHHRTTRHRLGTLLPGGGLSNGRLGNRSNGTTGEDSRSSREYEHIFAHFNLLAIWYAGV